MKVNDSTAPSTRKTTMGGLGFIILATTASVLIAGFMFGNPQFREFLQGLEDYSNDNRLNAMVLYVLIQSAVVIVLFPGLVFTLLAGYLFGPVVGTLVVVSGTVIGASTAFMISRGFFSGYFEGVLKRNPTMSVIAESVAYDGWKTVMLTRTIPLFPFKLSNYCFGVIPLSLAQFAAGTLLGVIPLTVTNVSIGALAADIDGLMAGTSSIGSAQYVLIGLGIVSGIATFLLVRKRAREKFALLERQNAGDGAAPACEGNPG